MAGIAKTIKTLFNPIGEAYVAFQRTGMPALGWVPTYRKYGLTKDDMVSPKNKRVQYSEVKHFELFEEALQKLTRRQRAEREFRIMRANRLVANREFLPKEQWTTEEEDSWCLRNALSETKEYSRRGRQWVTDNL